MTDAFQVTFLAAIVTFTLVAAILDLRTRRLPNWLTVPAFVAGIIMHVVMSGFNGLYFSLLGFATGFAILFILWVVGGGGGGDVKLMGALGAWLGPRLIIGVFLVSAVVILVIVMANMLLAFMSRGFSFVKHRYLSADRTSPWSARDEQWLRYRQRTRLLPYAVPVAISTWLVLLALWFSSSAYV